jgi:hypothetical protein
MPKVKPFFGLSAALAALACTSPALAQTEAGKVSISVSGGASLAVGGTMHGGANAPIADLGVLNPALAGVPATLQIEKRSQDNVYDTGWTIGGEIGYGVTDSGEALLSVRYLKAKGNQINVGGAAAGAPVNATLPVLGDFGDYKALALELGYRQYFGSGDGLRPFAAARVGATRISKISADFTVPDAGIALNGVPFSKSSWELSGGADVGVSIPVGENVSIEPEVGIYYTKGANGNDTALGGLGLGSINNKGERWSVPVRVRLKFAL